MMNDLDLLTTKKGMTFGKAWMLIFFMILSLLLVGMLVGFVAGYSGSDPSGLSPVLLITCLFTLTTCIAIVWGYYINLKEWPYFRKQNVEIIALTILAAFLLRFLTSVIEEIPLFMINNGATKKLLNEHLLNLLSLLIMLILQIGIIAHGLFRNYSFQRVVVTVLILSIVQLEPRAIIGLAVVSLILMIIYYKTGGFQLVLLVIGIYTGTEYLLSLSFSFDTTAQNNYRNVLIANDAIYFSLLPAGGLILAMILRRIARLSKPIKWEREVQYPAF